MNIWTTTEKIWWDDQTDNKPSGTYFEAFKNRMEDATDTLHVNQNSYDQIEIVVTDINITYIRINDGKYDYYYYYNKIINVLPECYRIQFSLDIFTTFTLPYFEYLRKNNINVKVNRHKKFDIGSLQLQDDLINAVPKFIQQRELKVTKTKRWEKFNKDYKLKNAYHNIGVFRIEDIDDDRARDLIANTTIYVVASDEKGYILVPAFYKAFADLYNKPKLYYNEYDATSAGREIFNYDPYYIVDLLLKDSRYKTKIIGLYLGPPFYTLSYDGPWDDNFGEDNKKQTLIYYRCTTTGIKMNRGFQSEYPLGALPEHIMNRPPKQLNEQNQISIYGLGHYQIKVANSPFAFYTIYSGFGYLRLGNNVYMNFSSSIFLISRSANNPNSMHILDYVGDLPLFIDKYQQYIASNKNTRDTSLAIAKQQTDLNTGFAVGNGLMGVISNIKNPLGMIGSIFSTAESVTKNIIGLQNKKDMMNAELADKKTTLVNRVQGGAVEDTSVATYILTTSTYEVFEGVFMGDMLEYDTYHPFTNLSINNILYLYGNYFPYVWNLDSLRAQAIDGVLPKFDYYQFDGEYLTNMFATTLRGAKDVPIQREFYSAIYNHLTQGIRLWKEKPEV